MLGMPRALALQHVAPETPGAISDALRAHGIEIDTVRIDLGQPVPATIGEADALIVMGGPMGVYEADRHPHLGRELALIESALRAERPILGVCLGSQLLAAALGAGVAPGPRKEIGWFPVTLEESAAADPLWRGIDHEFMAFHWHGDRFELPAGAASLARSERTPIQAYRYGTHTYGFLFHMEITREIVAGMVESFADEIAAEKIAAIDILEETERRLGRLAETGRAVFSRFAERVSSAEKGGR